MLGAPLGGRRLVAVPLSVTIHVLGGNPPAAAPHLGKGCGCEARAFWTIHI